jgi:hypothetical protein
MIRLSDFKRVWYDLSARGELIKNIGLGIFVNATYGLTDNSIEFYNILDLFFGLFAMLIGIIIERGNKWDI